MAALNEIIHQPVRLQIMAALVTLEAGNEVDFTSLRHLLEVTDGNLGAHLRKLEEAGPLCSSGCGWPAYGRAHPDAEQDGKGRAEKADPDPDGCGDFTGQELGG